MMWFVLWPLSLAFTILSMVLALVLPMFASSDGWLPRWLWWFQTADNSLNGDGNREAGTGWKGAHWQFRYELPTWLCTYVGRVGWLLRNPGYGFDFDVLGFNAGPLMTTQLWGDQLSSDTRDGWYSSSGSPMPTVARPGSSGCRTTGRPATSCASTLGGSSGLRLACARSFLQSIPGGRTDSPACYYSGNSNQ